LHPPNPRFAKRQAAKVDAYGHPPLWGGLARTCVHVLPVCKRNVQDGDSIEDGGGVVVCGFAANDYSSTTIIWHMAACAGALIRDVTFSGILMK
jgi:hypothetical protein